MISIGLVACGLVLTFLVYRKENWKENRRGVLLAGYILALGLVVGFMQCVVKNLQLELFCAMLGVGSLLVGAGAYNLRAVGLCRVKTEAAYCGRSAVALGLTAPIYQYSVDGVSYCSQSAEVCSGARADELEENGRAYIYVNAGKPDMFVLNPRVYAGDILVLLLGTLMIFGSVSIAWM